jgi:hypothetical protein
MWPLSKSDPIKEFWRWFAKNEPKLFDFEMDQERVFDKLSAQLQKVDPRLTFEFGPKTPARDFVVSAAGIKDGFPAVVSLVNGAPALERWRIIAFRPRRTPLNVIEFRDKIVDSKDVKFSLLDNGKTVGLYLFIPGLQDGDLDYQQVGYLMLDEALGEYDVEIGLGLIKMFPIEHISNHKRYPLADLPAMFDQLTNKLKGKSGLPS